VTEARGGCGKGPKGAPRSPKKGFGKEAAQKRAMKTKEGAVCVLEKGRKEDQSKGVMAALRDPGGP
jgi:hypothetical protein